MLTKFVCSSFSGYYLANQLLLMNILLQWLIMFFLWWLFSHSKRIGMHKKRENRSQSYVFIAYIKSPLIGSLSSLCRLRKVWQYSIEQKEKDKKFRSIWYRLPSSYDEIISLKRWVDKKIISVVFFLNLIINWRLSAVICLCLYLV